MDGGPDAEEGPDVLVVNAGSSSLKLSLVDPGGGTLAQRRIEGWQAGDVAPVGDFVADAGRPGAVAHRVVHGGGRYGVAALLDDEVLGGIRDLGALAPLHQGHSIAAIEATRACLAGVAEVACFDTAFHSTIGPAAYTYALPAEWRSTWPVRRYGFHGLSHSYSAVRAPELAGVDPSAARIVSCHLGSGSSLCAIAGGRSVDTTMGFTPLEGLVMSTRSGSVDPGLVLWLVQEAGLDPAQVSDGLQRRGGLAGLAPAAADGDMRVVEAGVAAGDPDATLAFQVYVHRLTQQIAAMTASLGGMDVLAFTGGVGEHSAGVRARTCEALGFLGVAVDSGANRTAQGDADLTSGHADVKTAIVKTAIVKTVVVTAREDLEMARETRSVLRA